MSSDEIKNLCAAVARDVIAGKSTDRECRLARELVERAIDAKEGDRWTPVGESLPRPTSLDMWTDADRMLVVIGDDSGRQRIDVAYHIGSGQWDNDNWGGPTRQVTHWRNLPGLPC